MSSSTSAPLRRRRRSNSRSRLQRGEFNATKASRSTPDTLPHMTSADPYATRDTLPARNGGRAGPGREPRPEPRSAPDPGTARPVPQPAGANQVVTGEAVALDLAPASVLSRLMS